MQSQRKPGLILFLLVTACACAAELNAGPKAVGSLATTGTVRVDRLPALPSTTLFSGDVVATDKASAAVMALTSGLRVTVAENSEVAFSLEGGSPQLNLRHGAVAVRTDENQSARVNVPGASLLVQGETGYPALCRIAAVGVSVAAFADRGRIEIHGSGGPLIVPAGKSVHLEAGVPQGATGQQAGKVSNAIPAETVQRQAKGAELELKVADTVNWEDVVRTLKAGRVRIQLLDGSFLNVGARSVMHITRHDPQTQQTDMEFTLGRLRGEVVKLTKPGASFQIRTQTAVIGVVGTIFFIHALPNLTRVHCIEGVLTVRNINPVIVGQATLKAGEFTTVPKNLPPTGVLRAPPAQTQSEIAQTNVQPTVAPGVAPPGAAGGAAPSAATSATTALSATTAVAAGTSVGVTTAAISSLTTANDTLNNATNSLTQATSASNTATASANAATAAANTAAAASNTVATAIPTLVVSPSQPGCGCQ